MPTPHRFPDILPRLTAAYHRGLLVPFLGAGMSLGSCPSWEALVRAMAAAAEVPFEPEKPRADQLVRIANNALRVLRRSDGGHAGVLAEALYAGAEADARGVVRAPAKTQQLARLWWPLVLTTNYDDLFARAYLQARAADRNDSFADSYGAARLDVRGRSPRDCQHVLSALDVTGRSVLWALHGFLPQSRRPARMNVSPGLTTQVVFGHEEYRRLAHASTAYRRAFAEVYRRRSLLFLGTSLSDVYLLDLFAEVQELYGAGPHPHYAIVNANSVDIDFLRTRFNIAVIDAADFGEMDAWMEALHHAVNHPRVHQSRWAFRTGLGGTTALADHAAEDDLEIVHGELPAPSADHAVAVSAGFWRNDRPDLWVSTPTLDLLHRGCRRFAQSVHSERGIAPRHTLTQVKGAQLAYECRHPRGASCQLVALRPWQDARRRDLRLVGAAAREAFAWANARGCTTLHMPLLGAGGTRKFAARFALAEIVRAWGRWRREAKGGDGHALRKLVVHMLARPALFELSSGRLDVFELTATSDVRFWVEVVKHDEVDREPMIQAETTTLADLMQQLQLRGAKWSVEVEPSPMGGANDPVSGRAARTLAAKSLVELGVLPGSTVRFVHRVPVKKKPVRR